MIESLGNTNSFSKFPGSSAENPNPILHIDSAGVLLSANPAAREILDRWQTGIGAPLPGGFRLAVLHNAKNKIAGKIETTAGGDFYAFQVSASEHDSTITLFGHDITDYKLDSARSDNASSQLKDILETITDGFFSISRDWRFLDINAVAEDLFGKPARQLVGRRLLDVFPEAHLSEAFHQYQIALSENRPVHFEAESKIYCGWYEAHAYPRTNHLDIYFRDITERKQAEKVLVLAKQKWERTFQSVPDLIAILDAGHRVVQVNEAMARRLNVPPEECVGLRCYEVVHGTSKPPEFCPHAKTMRDGAEHIEEVHEERLRGDYLVSTTPLLDDQGKCVGSVHVARDITHLKRVEEELRRAHDELETRVSERTVQLRSAVEALRQERQRFNDVLDILPAYVVLLTPDYHMPFINRFFRERFGDPGGKRCFEYLFGRNEPCENCQTYTVLKTMAPHRWEWSGPNGCNYDIFDFPFTDVDGATLILEMGLDITERKQTEVELAKHRHHLETMVHERTRRFELLAQVADMLLQNSAPRQMVDFLCHRVMEYLDCQAFFNFLVDERAGRLHLNACAGIPEEEARRIEWLDFGTAVCGCAARDGCRIVAEHIPTTPDPRTEMVKSYGIKAYACHPLLGRNGKITGTLSFGTRNRETFSEDDLSLMKAVTDQVAAAMLRMEDEQALLQNQADLKHAQAVARTGNWRLDSKRNQLFWSDETYRMFGIPVGTPLTYEIFLSKIHPEDRDFLDQKWQAAILGEPYDIEHRIIVNEQVKWVRERAELESDRDGTLLGGFGTVHDITERKQHEEQLQKTAADLAQSNQDLERFAYVASHDLQEPLRTIRAYVQLLEKRLKHKLDGETREFMGFVADGAARMQALILDLLAYSRLGAQSKPLAPIQIEKPLEEALYSLKASVVKHHAKITHDPLPAALADKDQIAQLFQNLIANAIKFRRHGIQPEVHISAKEQDAEWIFSVRDNGIGIDPKYFEKIFTVFQRLHTVDKYPGTGIGLAISKRIVERHGGRIWVESRPEQETTFFFSLPKP